MFNKDEEANIAYEEVVAEPDHKSLEKTERSINLKISGVADYAKYEIDSKMVHFLPTMMFTQRTHVLKIKNISLIKMSYRCKVVSAETGAPDTGYYAIYPKMGTIPPGVDE